MLSKHPRLLLATTCLLFVTTLNTVTRGADRLALESALRSIVSGDLRIHVNTLADDTFEGRESGSRGGRAAGGYLASHLQKAGLKPGGDNGSYFQDFGGSRNVLAVLEGSDPELRKQYVVLGAHYDHVGYGTPRNSYGPTGYIHNGADDNASGTSSLLELADAFASLPVAPKRTLIFAFWDGEEAGLLGSKHWTANPTVPLTQIAFAFNIDMLGRLRNDRIEMLGSRTSYGLRRLVAQHNAAIGLDIDFTWEMKGNSDHYSFVSRNIPILMPFTGLHDDYHRPSDDAEKINTAGMERVVRLLFLLAHDIAESAHRHKFRPDGLRDSPVLRQQFEKAYPPPPPRLGVTWKSSDSQPGLELTRVEVQSPADQAGLRTGDRLLVINDKPITNEQAFRIELLAAKSPAKFTVQRLSANGSSSESTVVEVKLAGAPLRVGITWRDDDAEPGTLLLTQVVPGSAAYQAGLRERDRVYEVNGHTFETADEFRQLLTTLPTPLNMLVERNGRTLTLELSVPAVSQD